MRPYAFVRPGLFDRYWKVWVGLDVIACFLKKEDADSLAERLNKQKGEV